MVAVSTVKTENGKVSCETPEGTVINININQRSCMDGLLDAIRNVNIVKKDGQCNQKDGQHNQPANVSTSGVHLGVGVSLMSLGFIGVMLAIIMDVVSPELYFQFCGAHYWTGFVFLVAGVLNVVAYKYTKALWVMVSYIALLACLAVSIAGMVFVAYDIGAFRFGWKWNDMRDLCDNLRQNQYPYGYQTNPPRYDYPRYDNTDYYLENCKNGFQKYTNLLIGLSIMSMVMMIWGLCVSGIPLLYRLKLFFQSCKCENAEEDKDDELLSPNPVQDIIIA